MKRDRTGLEIGGQFKLSLPPGVYELAVAVRGVKSKKAAAQSVASFAVEAPRGK